MSEFGKTRDQLNYLLKQTGNLLDLFSEIEMQWPLSQELHILSKPSDIEGAFGYLTKLEQRINDRQSKILVTGDVNAGKSTFVNTLLRRQIVPDGTGSNFNFRPRAMYCSIY